FGDIIHVGRSVLLFGTREEIAHRIHELRHDGLCGKEEFATSELAAGASSGPLSFELRLGSSEELQGTLHIPMPPDLPSGLTAGQAAQLSELIEYLHLRSRQIIRSANIENKDLKVMLTADQWQEFLDLQAQLAEYLKAIGDAGREE